jgi:flotillin
MGNVVVGTPNKAIIVSGFRGQQITVGGCNFVFCICEQWGSLNLEVVTLSLESNECETKQGVQVSIRSVAQVKVLANKYEASDPGTSRGAILQQPSPVGGEIQRVNTSAGFGGLQRVNTSVGLTDGAGKLMVETAEIDLDKIKVASLHFLGMEQEDLEEKLRETMEGHQRLVIGTLTVEELYRDREKFSLSVRKNVNTELKELGFCLLSYTVQMITDKDGYMQALGETQAALVQREAEEGIARHENEARKKVAQYTSEAEIAIAKSIRESHVHLNVELTAQAESDRDLTMRRAETARMINKANEEADAMTRITRAEQEKVVIVHEAQQQEEEAKVMVNITQQEMVRAKSESAGHSEAELMRKQNEAKGVQVESKAASQSAQLQAGASARVIQVKGNAEANVMKLKADAYKEYGQAAVVQQVVNQLPELAGKITNAVGKTDKMTYIAFGGKKRAPLQARALGGGKATARVVPGPSDGEEMREEQQIGGVKAQQQEEAAMEPCWMRGALDGGGGEEEEEEEEAEAEQARKAARIAAIRASKQRNSMTQMHAQRMSPASKTTAAVHEGGGEEQRTSSGPQEEDLLEGRRVSAVLQRAGLNSVSEVSIPAAQRPRTAESEGYEDDFEPDDDR